MITITLQKILDASPRLGVWTKVFKAHEHLGMDAEFPLSSVLESNGLDDAFWCLRCLPEHDNLWRKYAAWGARQAKHLMTDERSINALDVAWRYSDGQATDAELAAAGYERKRTVTGCRDRVERAISGPALRCKPIDSVAQCLPDVALYAAGHRKSNNVTAR